MRCAILHSDEQFSVLADRWDDLGSASQAGLFLSHSWLAAWWRAFHGIDHLWVFAVEDDDGSLVAGWPLHLRAPRSGALRVAELKLVGDLGGADRSLLCRPGREAEAATLLADTLLAARGWDVLDVPVARREIGDALERAIAGAGGKVERSHVYGRPYLDLPPEHEWNEVARRLRPARGV